MLSCCTNVSESGCGHDGMAEGGRMAGHGGYGPEHKDEAATSLLERMKRVMSNGW